jgi:hypothetical protein
MTNVTEFDLKAFLAAAKDDDGLSDHPEHFTLVDEDDWEHNYKDYFCRAQVFQHIPTGRYVCVAETRAGSYYTDYEYTVDDVSEVFQHTETITRTVYRLTP